MACAILEASEASHAAVSNSSEIAAQTSAGLVWTMRCGPSISTTVLCGTREKNARDRDSETRRSLVPRIVSSGGDKWEARAPSVAEKTAERRWARMPFGKLRTSPSAARATETSPPDRTIDAHQAGIRTEVTIGARILSGTCTDISTTGLHRTRAPPSVRAERRADRK